MYEKYLSLFYKELPLGETFDLIERKLVIGGRMATCFFVDGLTNGDLMQRVMDYLIKVQPEDMEGIHTSHRFLATHMPFLDATLAEPQLPTRPGEEGQAAPPRNPREWSEEQIYSAYHVAMTRLYSGLVPLMVEGLDRIIIIDARDYPSRPVEEPQKEKSLRGAKDGFTEGFMTNIALIRRRLRDNNLIFTHYTIGSLSKSDVAMVYMKDKADSQLVNHIGGLLKQMEQEPDLDTLTVGDQSLLEKILYVADYMEPNRDFPGVEALRDLAYTDITKALKLGLTMTLDMLHRQQREVSPESAEALAYLESTGV